MQNVKFHQSSLFRRFSNVTIFIEFVKSAHNFVPLAVYLFFQISTYHLSIMKTHTSSTSIQSQPIQSTTQTPKKFANNFTET
jgi:hypothetical protein